MSLLGSVDPLWDVFVFVSWNELTHVLLERVGVSSSGQAVRSASRSWKLKEFVHGQNAEEMEARRARRTRESDFKMNG